MSTTTYLSSRNLPCKYWLNASDSGAFNITGVSFDWSSSYGDSPVTFSTDDFNNLPTRDNNQVTVQAGAILTTDQVITGIGASYTLLYLSNNTILQSSESLVNLGDTFLDYQGNQLSIDYSRLGITNNNTVDSSYTLERRPIIGLTHDLKAKTFQIYQTEENTVYTNKLAYEKGIKLNNTQHKIEGPNLDISHILLFSPAIEELDVIAIIDSLVEETPELAANLIWDNITTNVWNSVTTPLWEGIK